MTNGNNYDHIDECKLIQTTEPRLCATAANLGGIDEQLQGEIPSQNLKDNLLGKVNKFR